MSRVIQLEEYSSKRNNFSIFSYGFRPFFLAVGIYAVLPLIPWALYLTGYFATGTNLQSWHAHEMLFGFVAAGISGFLLTAIPNWTGTAPLTGNGLKLFFCFWLSGRLAFWLFLFLDSPYAGYLLFLDLLLPIAHGIRITHILITTKNTRNFIFIGIMAALVIADLMFILDMNHFTDGTSRTGAIFTVNIIMMMVAVIGGRVTPNFTRSYLQQQNIAGNIGSFPIVESLAIGLLVLNALADVITPHSNISYSIAILACAVHAIRFSRWQTSKIMHQPILWVLHAGYLLLVVTLFLKGSETFLNLPYNLYLHAFTVGSAGLYILGIVTRASLGHTGRPLIIKPAVTAAYLLVICAVVVRVTSAFYAEHYINGMIVTIAFWSAAFLLYLKVYAPILTRPRVDGRPG